jgi:hypothetical protein
MNDVQPCWIDDVVLIPANVMIVLISTNIVEETLADYRLIAHTPEIMMKGDQKTLLDKTMDAEPRRLPHLSFPFSNLQLMHIEGAKGGNE